MAGRKAHAPDDKSRQQVKTLASYGLTDLQIAAVVGVSETTLKKHYRDELDQGRPIGLARVAQTAYQLAISGKVPVMTMFWLKCRAGWREQDGPSEGETTPGFNVSPDAGHQAPP